MKIPEHTIARVCYSIVNDRGGQGDQPGLEHIMSNVTAFNHDNDRVVEMMMGKAICAYANMREAKNNMDELVQIHGRQQVILHIECLNSEYEATVRCIDMLVKEPLHEVCRIVIARCAEELGVC